METSKEKISLSKAIDKNNGFINKGSSIIHKDNCFPHEKNVCELCDAPLPVNPVKGRGKEEDKSFCCLGCFHVHSLLNENGYNKEKYKESDLYKISENLGILQNKGASSIQDIRKNDPNTTELIIHLEGIWCYSCTWIIEKVLNELKGVYSAQVSFSTDSATIIYNPMEVSADDIISTVKKLGYGAFRRDDLQDKQADERTSLLIKMGVSIFLLMNIMYFSYIIYIGLFQKLSTEISRLVPYLLLVLATPSVLWCGSIIHKKAFWSLRNRKLSMEVLLSISLLSSFIFSIFSLIRGSNHIYFDTSAGLVALLLVGKYIEVSAKHKAMENINRLYMMLPGKARIKTDDGTSLVSVDMLKEGDRFIVYEGEKIPADGVIIKGETTIDESMLTGEGVPVLKKIGDGIFGSTINYDGIIEAEVTAIGSESVLSRIIKLVENAMMKKSKIEQIADQFSRYFIPFILVISFVVFVFNLVSKDNLETALIRGITILVIACPCALGIATPLAVLFGIQRSTKEGVLIRDGSILQNLGSIDTVVFDKTGTITEGRFTFKKINGENLKKDTLSVIASVEKCSNHPIGKAIVSYCLANDLPLYEAVDFVSKPGMGLKGVVDAGKEEKQYDVVLGNEKFLESEGRILPGRLKDQAFIDAEAGNSIVFFSINEKDTGYISLNDKIKKSVNAVVTDLEESNVDVMLLSGDSEITTSKIAGMAGIKLYKSGSIPSDKLVEIAALQKNGKTVAMVGDGINDAPAIAQANIGIAMGSGTDIAIESSDIVMLRNDISLLPFIINMSKRTIKVIKQNLIWAFLYNTIGVILAANGILNPLLAALAMIFSSLSVIGNSTRLGRVGRAGTSILQGNI